jgi:hypothetical protein
VRWLAPSEVVVACCANNLDLARDPERGLQAFAWLASTAVGVELSYQSSADAAALVADLLTEVEPPSIPYAVEWDDEQTPAGTGGGAGVDEVAPSTPTGTADVHEVVLEASPPVHDAADADHPAARWRRSADVVTVGIGGEAVLYHRGSRTVARLNAGAAQRWVDLGEDMAEADDEDTDRLWRQLADEELVVPVEDGAFRTQR